MNEQSPRASAALVEDIKSDVKENGKMLNNLDKTMGRVEQKLETMCSDVTSLKADVKEHDGRLDFLEKHLFAIKVIGAILVGGGTLLNIALNHFLR